MLGGQAPGIFDGLKSLDYRYMWNYNLYKQFRLQHIPNHWQIPLVQGYVGHAEVTNEIDVILISRRRWPMGGTRYNARGIDDDGNTANTVESEQILIKRKFNKDKNQLRVNLFSYSQLRGTVPVFWTQVDGKVKLQRTVDSSAEIFMKHVDSIFTDYERDSFLMLNLLGQNQTHEELLTQSLRKLIDETAKYLEQRKGGKRIDYDYFDFHTQYKKNGGAAIDQFIGNNLKNLYLNKIGLFNEKASYNYCLGGKDQV